MTLLRILRGAPSDEELAALLTVLAAAGNAAAPAAARSTWGDPAHGLRIPQCPGPDAWRTSVRPR